MSTKKNDDWYITPWTEWQHYVGDGYVEPQWEEPSTKVKCECGTTLILGAEDSPELHQYYCPIFKEYKSKDIK